MNDLKHSYSYKDGNGLEIAVIGMAGRFPGAGNINEFWDNLKNGIESIYFYTHQELEEAGIPPAVLNQEDYVKAAITLEGIEYFDAGFFGYTPKEAEITDPQVRICHECVYEALEDAGYDPGRYDGLIGLYTGASPSFNWEALIILSGQSSGVEQFSAVHFYDKDFMSARISHKLNLIGPSFTLHTACSTSLVAIHLACQAILNGECDMALAGGVTVTHLKKSGYRYTEGMIMSPDGHCRAFDARSAGLLAGEGAGIVVLKRLEDAHSDRDHIYAVVKGSAINNDGVRKLGFTAPSVEGQAEAIKAAQQMAEVEPESIGYIETHGTATPLGDVTEIEALKLAFNSNKKQFCALGAVKTNTGHLDTAAGVTGFIKTVLTIKYKQIPPVLHFEKPNPKIDFENTPFYVNTERKEWKSNGKPLRAGVSSFGIGGTNAHVILEEAPEGTGGLAPLPGEKLPGQSRDYQLILLSAKTETALDKMTENLARYLKENPGINLVDVAYTLKQGRKHFQYRRRFVCPDVTEAIETLTSLDSGRPGTYLSNAKEGKKPVVFMFSGLGSQYVNMGRGLYQTEPLFRKEMNYCFEILKSLMDLDIKEILYPFYRSDRSYTSYKSYKSHINQFEIAQLVTFIFEYSLARLLMAWGVEPWAMIGYSLGEYSAACLSGVFTLEHALKLLVIRGKLIRELPPGMMLNVPLPAKELQPLLHAHHELCIGIDNGSSCVISGPTAAVKSFEKQVKQEKLICISLDSTHAIHSTMMDPILKKFAEQIDTIPLNTPQIPYISTVTGNWPVPDQVTSSAYWTRQLRETVCFSRGIRRLLKEPGVLFLEMGAGREIAALVKREIGETGEKPDNRVVHLVKHRSTNIKKEIPDAYYLLDKIGLLWLYGVPINWSKYYAEERRYRLSLPTYPFEKHRFWKLVDNYHKGKVFPGSAMPGAGKSRGLSDCFYVPSWKETISPLSSAANDMVNKNRSWLIFLDEDEAGTGIGKSLTHRINQNRQGDKVITVTKGEKFSRIQKHRYIINPTKKTDYDLLVKDLCTGENFPGLIVHLWSLAPGGAGEDADLPYSVDFFKECQETGYYSLLFLAQSLVRYKIAKNLIDIKDDSDSIQIEIVLNNVYALTNEKKLLAEKATILGLCRSIPQEYPNIRFRSIDIDISEPGTDSTDNPGFNQWKLMDKLVAEFMTPPKELTVAYRGNSRWVQRFEPLKLEHQPGPPKLLRKKGVYLITGGLGNDSFIRSKYLAETLEARLVLTGRTRVPKREYWSQYLMLHDREDEISIKIKRIQELEELGAEVLAISADVADEFDMRMVMKEIDETFGQLNGVIHAAGITDIESSRLLMQLDSEESEWHFQPKVYGLYVLEKILKDRDIDFCLLTSSIASIISGIGLSAYTAASIFMDMFTRRQNRIHSGPSEAPAPWISLNWQGTSAEETVEAFKRILSLEVVGGVNQLIFSKTHIDTLIRKRIELESPVNKVIGKDDKPALLLSRPDLSTPYAAPGTATEKKLADIWQGFFGIEKIGINDDLYDLGGDSLKAMNIISIVHKKLNVVIPLKEFFDHSTIEGVARYIDGAEKEEYIPVTPVEKKQYYTLSPAQKRLYILQQMDKECLAYNVMQVAALEGNPDPRKLEKAFRQMIKRYAVFRTSIRMKDQEPVQQVHDADDFEFAIKYYEAKPGDMPDEIIWDFISPFDLSRVPLLRGGLIKTGEHGNNHLLVIDMHHIVTDGVSHEIFRREFIELYKEEELPLVYLQYIDYAEWQNNPRGQLALVQQETYWLSQFQQQAPVLNLPTDYARPPVQSFAGSSVSFGFSKEETGRLKEFAAKKEATLFMVLFALYDTFLTKITGQEDVVVGTGIVGRRHTDLQHIMGVFVNTLAIRSYPKTGKTFREFLEEIKESITRAFDNQEYPFEKLVEKVGTKRDTSRNPLFDTMFVLQIRDTQSKAAAGSPAAVSPVPESSPIPALDLTVKSYRHSNRISKFDLTLFCEIIQEELYLSFEYCTKLFEAPTIEKFITYFKEISASALANPHQTLLEINKISRERKQEITRQLNRHLKKETEQFCGPAGNLTKPLQQQLQQGFKKFSQGTAIEYGNQIVTYRELDRVSAYIANWLIHKGIPSETFIGILLANRVEFISVMLGVLKTRCVFVPLDSSYPPDRLTAMIKSTGVRFIITDREKVNSPRLTDDEDIEWIPFDQVISPDKPTGNRVQWFERQPDLPYSPEDIIYIYFTSGTTGTPRAMMGKNQSLLHFIHWEIKTFAIRESGRISQLTTPVFDAFLRDIFAPLCAGGVICIPPTSETLLHSRQLSLWLEQSRLYLLHCVPAVFRLLSSSELINKDSFRELNYILLSGEPIYPPHLEHWYDIFGKRIQLVNLWGTSETTLAKTCYYIRPADVNRERIPVGTPLPGARVVVLDETLEICDQLVIGELYIKTPFAAAGYYNDPGLNLRRFIPDPFIDTRDSDFNCQLHKTGDLGRILADGNIDVIGRNDRQVKVRGIRVELEEIESILAKHPMISDAVVIKKNISADNELLCGYITTAPNAGDEESLFIENVKEYASGKLPDYMVPGQLVKLEKIPRKPNGKVDYDALPDPLADEKIHMQSPRDNVEKKLLELWSDILGIGKESIGITSNFFQLGGNSLNIMTLISRVHREFDIRIMLAEIFNNPTIEKQAKILGKPPGESLAEEKQFVPIDAVEKKEHHVVSSSQERLYVLQQMDPDSTVYNMPEIHILELEQQHHKNKLEQTFRQLIRRHESLRTSFRMVNEKPVQCLHEEVDFEIEYDQVEVKVEGEEQTTDDRGQRTEGRSDTHLSSVIRHLSSEFIRPFDLSRAPLLRVGLIKIHSKKHILMVDMHHIISDGVSHRILVKDFFTLYSGGQLSELRIQYKDYSEWQREKVISKDERDTIKRQEEYWLSQFDRELPVIDLPLDFARPELQDFEGRTLSFIINPEDAAVLRNIALEEGSTLYMMILAIFYILLAKLSSQEDIIVGTDIAGRTHAQLEPIIGMFVNTLVLRNFPAGNKPFKEFLLQVKEKTLAAFQNQDYPFEELVEQVAVNRDPSRNPMFDVLFSFMSSDHTPPPQKTGKENSLFKTAVYSYENQTAKFDLTLNGSESGEHLSFFFEYCTKLFKKETIQRFIDYFKKIVSAVIHDPGQKISGIEIISKEEKKQILLDFNNTKKTLERDRTYTRIFEDRVSRHPDRLAVVSHHQHITYRILNEEANRIAGFLGNQGVTAAVLVALYLERSIALLASIIGVFKAGGAYLPLETDYPRARVEYILENSEASVVIAQKPTRGPLISLPKQVLFLEPRQPVKTVLQDYPGNNPQKNNRPEHLAYMIYTSGTTGTPKGVMIHHLGMLNHLYAKIKDLSVTSRDIIAQTASACFDISVWQFLAASMKGGHTCIIQKEVVLEPYRFLQVLQKKQVTILESVPSLMTAFLETVKYENPGNLKSLRWMIATGEPLSPHLVKEWRKLYPNSKLMNAYGPTEASDDVTHYVVDDIPPGTRSTVPIGKPLQNLHIYILDKHLLLCPVGVKGEICVAGIGVGKGYWKDDRKTAQSFIPNPYFDEINDADFSILYKTGDIGYFTADGDIECLGRGDEQVKIRGNRIELEEIRQHLLNHEKVKEAAVILKRNKTGENFICAYVVANNTGTDQLREYLSHQLPAYMIPSYFVSMHELPLTPNGKLDRGALPEPAVGEMIEEHPTPPRNRIEEKLAILWADVLGIDKNTIGIDDNFFGLGGHSLKATVLAANIHRELKVKIPLVEIFRTPFIRGLAEFIKNKAMDIFLAIEPVEKKDYYLLSSAQKRLYILYRMDKASIAYNMSQVLRLAGQWEKEELEDYFQQLIRRHESLRTSFHVKDTQPVQRVHDAVEFEIEYYQVEVKVKVEEERSSRLEGTRGLAPLLRDFIRPFDLSQAPLLRVGLIKLPHTPTALRGHPSQEGKKDQYILMVDMHHIISDGVSEDILVKDFLTMYDAKKLTPLRLQYKDFSQWQNREKFRETLKPHRQFWLKQLTGEMPVLNLPYDYPRPAVQSFEGSTVGFVLERETANALKQLALEAGATIYMVLLALYNILLSKITLQEDIIVGTPIAGRRHADLEQIIGMFVNTLVMRNYPAGEQTFKKLLESVKKRTLEAFDNQDYQFEELVEQVSVTRDPRRNPLFDVMLVLETMERDTKPGKDSYREFRAQSYEYEKHLARFDLTLYVTDTPHRLIFTFEYCTRLFKQETIQRFARYFKTAAASVCGNPGQKLGEIEIISPGDKRQLLIDFNRTETAYPKDKTIHELFEEQVERAPDNIAVTGPLQIKYRTYRTYTTYISYRKLNDKSNRLAHLLQEKGVVPDTIVAIMVPRCVEMIIGILGILKAGGAYLPIDPQYPEERINYMLKDSSAGILLKGNVEEAGKSEIRISKSETNLNDQNPNDQNKVSTPIVLNFEHLNFEFVSNFEFRASNLNSSNLAYIIYTSGSTGIPKGSLVSHRNVVRLVKNTNYINWQKDDRLLQGAALEFDASTFEIWGPLLNGLQLYPVSREMMLSAEKIKKIITKHKITTLWLTAPLFNRLVDADLEIFPGLRNLLVGGDVLSTVHINKARAAFPSLNIINGYGPTENTTFSTTHLIEKEYPHGIPIGKPIANSTVYILDGHGRLVPLGCGGELCVGGDGVSRGYLNNPELTAERYLFLFYRSYRSYKSYISQKVYHTGDLARWLPDGIIEFLGRIDQQVKIRGFRVEVEEIEKQLLRHSLVKEAVVIHRENKDSPGEKYLCAYVTFEKESGQKLELRNYLSLHLPEYMIPAYFVQLDKIPLTPNGKVNRKILPEPQAVKDSRYIAPVSKREKIIAAVWKEVLKRDEVGIDDNFFASGGNSLDIIQLSSRLNQVLEKEIDVITLFEYTTIRSFSDYLRRKEGGSAEENKPPHVNKHKLQERKRKVRRN
jgi:amino acid adenylation domain-containing protein